jgi:hypothetical protein
MPTTLSIVYHLQDLQQLAAAATAGHSSSSMDVGSAMWDRLEPQHKVRIMLHAAYYHVY